jgi:hypothetical protein
MVTSLLDKNKAMTTLGNVMEKAIELSADCYDRFIPVEDISFDSLEKLLIAGEEHGLKHIAQQSVSFRLGIPLFYLKKCPSDIQAYNMNHWIKEEKNEKLLFRFDGDDVRAIFTPRYNPVDNLEILEGLTHMGYSDDTPVQHHLDKEFFLINIPDGKATFKINREKMTPGISISNSEVGLASVSIAAYVLRLVCTNGMIKATGVSAKYKHTSRKILDLLPDVMQEVGMELADQKRQITLSLNSPVDNPLNTIDSFNRQFLLGATEKEALEWAWPQEAGNTMFNIINAYTKAAQFEGLPAASSYKLQKVGGDILAMVN